jgi:hypothetical protein
VIGGGDLVTVIAGCGSSRAWRRPHLPALRNRTGEAGRTNLFVAPKNIFSLFSYIYILGSMPVRCYGTTKLLY